MIRGLSIYGLLQQWIENCLEWCHWKGACMSCGKRHVRLWQWSALMLWERAIGKGTWVMLWEKGLSDTMGKGPELYHGKRAWVILWGKGTWVIPWEKELGDTMGKGPELYYGKRDMWYHGKRACDTMGKGLSYTMGKGTCDTMGKGPVIPWGKDISNVIRNVMGKGTSEMLWERGNQKCHGKRNIKDVKENRTFVIEQKVHY